MEPISTESVGPPGVKPPHLLLPLLLPQPETYVPLHTAVQSPPLGWHEGKLFSPFVVSEAEECFGD